MKWRNSEGREFPANYAEWAITDHGYVDPYVMRDLGYELVDAEEPCHKWIPPLYEPEEFEADAFESSRGTPCLYHPNLIPGKTYVVREKR